MKERRGSVAVDGGHIEYLEAGRGASTLVFVGGLAMDESLWSEVVAELSPAYRCIVLNMPTGAHRRPMDDSADLTLRGQAVMLRQALERLELSDVTLVQSDMGTVQLLAAEGEPRIGRLVLCAQEAFENYPPGLPGRMIALAAKLPGGLALAIGSLRVRALRRSPFMLGRMAERPLPHELTDRWLAPLFRDRRIRRDLGRYVGHLDRGILLAAAERLPTFDRPTLVVWGKDDRVMPLEHGRRLTELLPRADLIELDDCGTLIPLDQPAELARHIRRFVEHSAAVGAASGPASTA